MVTQPHSSSDNKPKYHPWSELRIGGTKMIWDIVKQECLDRVGSWFSIVTKNQTLNCPLAVVVDCILGISKGLLSHDSRERLICQLPKLYRQWQNTEEQADPRYWQSFGIDPKSVVLGYDQFDQNIMREEDLTSFMKVGTWNKAVLILVWFVLGLPTKLTASHVWNCEEFRDQNIHDRTRW